MKSSSKSWVSHNLCTASCSCPITGFSLVGLKLRKSSQRFLPLSFAIRFRVCVSCSWCVEMNLKTVAAEGASDSRLLQGPR